jgi:hypothetical protein
MFLKNWMITGCKIYCTGYATKMADRFLLPIHTRDRLESALNALHTGLPDHRTITIKSYLGTNNFFSKKKSTNPFQNLLSPLKLIYLYRMGQLSMQDAIQQFLKQSRLKGSIQALQIEDVWEQIMGKTIARYTDKIQIINQTLFISSTIAPLKNELLYQKEKIIERVNEALGEKVINEVVIK